MATDLKQETIITLLNGMNQSVDAMLLSDSEYYMAANITSRKGLVMSRPGFNEIKEIAASGKYQGGFFYETNSLNQFVFGVDGHVWAMNLSTLVLTDHGLLLSATSDVLYFVKAEQYCIVQDDYHPTEWADANWPVIIDGAALYDQSAMRASTPKEACPKGGPMAYVHGRLFTAVPYTFNGTAVTDNVGLTGFIAGDIVKAHAKDDVLKHTSTDYLNEGGRIIPAQELGFIYAMGSQRNISAGVDQGPLVVGFERGFISYQVNAPRAQWKTIDFGKVMFSGTGTKSSRAFVNSNSDIIYRAIDGWRTLASSHEKFSGIGLDNDPISSPIRDVIELDNKADLPFVSGAKTNNRFLMSANAGDNNTFQALVSLDVSAVSAMNTNTKPIYDGVWTGYDFYEVMLGEYEDEDRIMAVVRDSDGAIRLMYLNESEYQDDADTDITSKVETPFKHFSNPFVNKEFRYVEFFVSDIKGDVSLKAYYRPDHDEFWARMTQAHLKGDASGSNQRRGIIRLTPESAVPVDPIENKCLNRGFMFQFLIEWTGHMRIDRMRFYAQEKAEDFDPSPTETNAVKLAAASDRLDIDFYDYEVT